MTTWSVGGVAGFCRKAGWRGDDLAQAVSVAIAASNGQDHYRYNPGHTDATERRGLFALIQSDHQLPGGTDLFSPQVSAHAAYGRWRDEGKHWRWHLAWVSGNAARTLAVVQASLTQAEKHSLPAVPGSFEDSLHNMLHRAQSMREVSLRLRGTSE